MSAASMWTPPDIVGAAFSVPLTSIVVAIFLALVVEAWVSRSATPQSSGAVELSGAVHRRHRAELFALAALAAAVVLAHLVDFVLRSYVLDMSNSTASMRFALPVVVAAVGLTGTVILILTRGSAASVIPVLPSARRAWWTFSRRRDLVAASIVAAALVATTIAAGLASSTDQRGQHIWLIVPVPNVDAVDPLRLHFFGWTYGVPVLLGVVALLFALLAALRVNASRSFVHPETVADERIARRSVAAGATRIAAAATALALAGASRLIASTGSVTGIVIMGQNDGDPYESPWRYAELATAAGWVAPGLEVAAYTTLFVVILSAHRQVPWRARDVDRSTYVGSAR